MQLQRELPTVQGTTSDTRAVQQPPSISLPKGGGAIRGIGEKFTSNPVTGTGSLSIPIYTSPGRSGFGPQLSISYNSGAGNGAFGFGWNLSLPSIMRKTEKGLPQYLDSEESDVFVLSDAEDLVPELQPNGSRFEDTATVEEHTYTIHRYRPRIEGLFARIERWTRQSDGDVHWRSLSQDNILTLYGKDEKSRITDPDPSKPHHIFSWLICETRDDKGNAIIYDYVEEDSVGIDLTQSHERNRGDYDDLRRKVNCYIKRIRYGNLNPLLTDDKRPHLLSPNSILDTRWLFEVVFDYGGHDASAPTPLVSGEWVCRHDPFSVYRAGFEIRTYRLCQRVLMFHHFPTEPDVGSDCLVRSTDFVYRDNRNNTNDRKKGHPVASFIASITQSGYKRQATAEYFKKTLPPIEFEYSEVPTSQQLPQQAIDIVDPQSLENLPSGLDGTTYRWVDLDGEGLSGSLTEQAGAWFYKRNLSSLPVNGQDTLATVVARFAPAENIAFLPSSANLNGGRQQLMDLAGDGQLDLVQFFDPLPGYFERTHDGRWETFRPFTSIPNIDWDEPNLRFIDLNGDGHADVLITEHETFTWYPSLKEDGFGPARSVHNPLNEEKGPRLVFSDGTNSIYLADMCGDGLTDLVRIRNGNVSYWPNLGYGHFGGKVTMDDAPWFDRPDQFDQQRVRLADIDGSGTNDIIYLGHDSVRLYFNESGNRWSNPHVLPQFPPVDNLTTVMTADLLGNGTACLVWSSPNISDAGQPMRYIDLMGGQKPHLLTKVVNNLGVETNIHYAPSTEFYLADKEAGKPWVTKLPFPVHAVERVETYDHISRNHFVTRYAYHHGHFDGREREFRGFGMVEQWDTEEFATLTSEGALSEAANVDAASHVPTVFTRTWFHTGAFVDRSLISHQFESEYYREAGLSNAGVQSLLLPDTVIPPDLTFSEEREACRALKGSMLRQEVYALDNTRSADYPFTVVEQNFTIERLQAKNDNRHAVFFTHPREVINYHYERNPADPRVSHAVTLQVDSYGNILREVDVNYPRRIVTEHGPEQNETHLTLTINRFANVTKQTDGYRTGLPVETLTYEVVKPPTPAQRYTWKELNDLVTVLIPLDQHEASSENVIPYEQWDWRKQWNPGDEPGGLIDGTAPYTLLRLIEHVRHLYRPNDLGKTQSDPLLTLGTADSLALLGERYELAFTQDMLDAVFQRDSQPLLAMSANVLEGQDEDRGGYVISKTLKNAGYFPNTDSDDRWWIPSGQTFYSPNPGDAPSSEFDYAVQHFFAPLRYSDPFGETTKVKLDDYDLLIQVTVDPVENMVSATNDYRTLKPIIITDPNRNRSQIKFDALGMVVGTALMGKANEAIGDTLVHFKPEMSRADLEAFYDADNPHAIAQSLLQDATSRIVYDLHRYHRTKKEYPDNPDYWQPVYAATIARETHVSDLIPGDSQKTQISFSYSDGFGREIQQKIQAEPEIEDGSLRWVGSGWTVFNNKGKPVRQYEPFFSDLASKQHQFEFGNAVGVSPILFYDPLGRVIATLHPNHTYEKVVFDAWKQTTWDVNDTVLLRPEEDEDTRGFFYYYDTEGVAKPRLPEEEHKPSWYDLRTADEHEAIRSELWQNVKTRNDEMSAAQKAHDHRGTPSVVHLDTMGRAFLSIADNGLDGEGVEQKYRTRTVFDIEGNARKVLDAKDRVVMQYEYDMLGNQIHQSSMEAGERWVLNDVLGNPIRRWDSRGHNFRTAYDQLRRPIRLYVIGVDNDQSDKRTLGQEILFEKIDYGEGVHTDQADDFDQKLNLRTNIFKHYDGAGVVTNEAFDFKGNLARTTRQLCSDYEGIPDWSGDPAMDPEIFKSRTTFDALNRPTLIFTPNTEHILASIIRPTYNESNLLERVDVVLRGAQRDGQAQWTPFITNINYDAKGQRTRIDYGSGVTTAYWYDPLTFRLSHLQTKRSPTTFPDDCVTPPPAQWPGCDIQSLHYTYDPVGNITSIRDDAQQTIFFKNQRVEPSTEYTYDAIYRLIRATGREHLGQANGGQQPKATAPDAWNTFHINKDHPNNINAMGRYIEHYDYDEVGNFKQMRHHTSDPQIADWTRTYEYLEKSLIDNTKESNRLSKSPLNSDPHTASNHFAYDAHGNMIKVPHLQLMVWDFKDQLQQTKRQVRNNGEAETTYYVYDAAGQRVRKVTENHNGKRVKERIYLGGFEVYREYNPGNQQISLERETLHIMDDKQRIALIETRTQGNDGSPEQLIRYQHSNHLGTATLELNHQGQIISYEEYYPYGGTSYQAVNKAIKAAAKRYRYTGKERDEENGLYYHGARYYASWLGRWLNPDPAGIDRDPNLYDYVLSRPVSLFDPDGQAPAEAIHAFFQQRETRFEQYAEAYHQQGQPVRAAVMLTEAAINTVIKNLIPTTEDIVVGSQLGPVAPVGVIGSRAFKLGRRAVSSLRKKPAVRGMVNWSKKTLGKAKNYLDNAVSKKPKPSPNSSARPKSLPISSTDIKPSPKVGDLPPNLQPVQKGKWFEQEVNKLNKPDIDLNDIKANFKIVDVVKDDAIASITQGQLSSLKSKFFELMGEGSNVWKFEAMLDDLTNAGVISKGKDEYLERAELWIPDSMVGELREAVSKSLQGQELFEKYGEKFIRDKIVGK